MEKCDLLKLNQELQHQLNEVQKSKVKGLQGAAESQGDDDLQGQRLRQATTSLPSQHSSEGEEGYIEEEHGFSLMHDSKVIFYLPLSLYN